jgi:hypothetical protein
MIARLLYAAVALCLLGTWPERTATRPAPSVDAGATGRAAGAGARPPGIPPGRAEFAMPRIQR